MNEEPEQSEWRRRITESMAATTYEQLKALVEGVSGGFAEVAASFRGLEHRLDQMESALNEASLGFGREAERVRGSFSEHTKVLSEQVAGASSDLVRDLTAQTQEISSQFAALGEEISSRLVELHAEQKGQLSAAQTVLTETASLISTDVVDAITRLRSHVEKQTTSLDAAITAMKEGLERDLTTLVSMAERTSAAAEASATSLGTAIDDLRRRVDDVSLASAKTGSEHDARLVDLAQRIDKTAQALAQENTQVISDARAALLDALTVRLEELGGRLRDLRGPQREEMDAMLRGVVREQSKDAAARWDGLLTQIAARAGDARAAGDDLLFVTLIRSLEELLDERDRRIVAMLEEAARSMPARRRAPFLYKAERALAAPEKPPTKRRP